MKKNKSLQRFTDFEKLKTVEDFTNLEKKDPKEFKAFINWLLEKLNKAISDPVKDNIVVDRYFDKIEKLLPISLKEDTEKNKTEIVNNLKRDRWYVNDSLIMEYINKVVTESGAMPTNTKISENTGLSRVTIDKHIKERGLSFCKKENIDKFTLLREKAVSTLYKIGINQQDVKALKTFLDFTAPPEDNKKNVVNNYIQINNLKISTEDIKRLPAEDILQIEKIVSKTLLIE